MPTYLVEKRENVRFDTMFWSLYDENGKLLATFRYRCDLEGILEKMPDDVLIIKQIV